MLTIKHAFNSKIQSVTLVHALGSHFFSPFLSNNLLSGCVMLRGWAINELFPLIPKIQSKVECVRVWPGVFFKEKKRESSPPPKAHTPLYIYIYIYCTLHTLVGRLDLMGQSSELGWAHKKSSNNLCPVPLWTTMQKHKLTLIYDIIKLIM